MRKMAEASRRAAVEEGGGSKSNRESLHTPRLCGVCVRLCVEESAQKTGSAVLNNDHLHAS